MLNDMKDYAEPAHPLPDRAISVRQPWAIIHAGKDIENRHGKSTVLTGLRLTRGAPPRQVAIHAAGEMTQREYREAAIFMARIGIAAPMPAAIVRQAIIGTVWVTDQVRASQSPWFFGPVGLVLTSPEPITPVPCKGELGLFDWRRKLTDDSAPIKPWMVEPLQGSLL